MRRLTGTVQLLTTMASQPVSFQGSRRILVGRVMQSIKNLKNPIQEVKGWGSLLAVLYCRERVGNSKECQWYQVRLNWVTTLVNHWLTEYKAIQVPMPLLLQLLELMVELEHHQGGLVRQEMTMELEVELAEDSRTSNGRKCRIRLDIKKTVQFLQFMITMAMQFHQASRIHRKI